MSIILKPFAWLLLVFYEVFSSYGLALILFAIVIKTILFPVTLKGKKSMIQMNMLSGRMQQLQKQYGKDKMRYNMEVQKLYEREKVNPMGGCLWSMIPLILLIALYAIIREPLTNLMDVPKDMIETVAQITGVANTGAYPQIAMAEALGNPGVMSQVQAALGDAGNKLFAMDFSFLGINLAALPNWKFWEGGMSWGSIGLFLLPLVSTAVSFLSMKVSMATNKISRSTSGSSDAMDRTNKTMLYTMPLMSLWIGFTVPAGLSIYWIAQYVVTMVQEVICSKLLKKDYEAAQKAAEERERQEKEEEKRRKEEARLERLRRAEEEKKNRGKKKALKDTSGEPGINKEDSRIGIRAYARGRAYDPNRFGGVTAYVDPSELISREQQAAAERKGKKPAKAQEKGAEKPQVEQAETVEQAVVQTAAPETAAPAQQETADTHTAPVEQEAPGQDEDQKEGV